MSVDVGLLPLPVMVVQSGVQLFPPSLLIR
jgi:hypothetical protein